MSGCKEERGVKGRNTESPNEIRIWSQHEISLHPPNVDFRGLSRERKNRAFS
jgi:hypothetical protein